MFRWAAAVVALVACAAPDGRRPGRSADPVRVPLAPAAQLTRVSLALRGLRPTPDELRVVTQDPDRLTDFVDRWLDDPAFGATMRDLHAEVLLVRADTGDLLPAVADLAGVDQHAIHRSMAEAPLVLAEDIVLSDRPYTEVVTADHTWADPVVATIWGLPYDPDGPTWQRTRWVDGRHHAGLLSDSSLWLRHVSNGSNFHRGRANFVARAFLCADFDDRDITLTGDIDVADELAVAHAVRTEPSCVACHQALDPLAGFFWGYKTDILRSSILRAYRMECREEYREMATGKDYCYPLRLFNPEFEHDWAEVDLRAPGYFGEPGAGMADLGRQIADDPRFAACTARRFAGYLTQTDLADVPDDEVARLQGVLVDSGWSAKALTRAIVTSPRFLADHATDDGVDLVGPQIVRPEQLARTLHAVTGFAWRAVPDGEGCADTETGCWGEDDLLLSDAYGFRAMAGGQDSVLVNRPTHTMTPSRGLVLDRLAGEAAAFVVDHDLGRPVSQRRLLTRVEADTLHEPTVRAQLVDLAAALHGRLYPSDDPEVDALWDLFAAFAATSGPSRAWTLVLTAMLQDPAAVVY